MDEPPIPKVLKSTGKTIPVFPISTEKLLWTYMKPGLLYVCFQQQIIYAFPRLNSTFGGYMKAILDTNRIVMYVYCIQ